MHWWGDFPIDTTLTLIGIVVAVSIGSYFFGRWWDERK